MGEDDMPTAEEADAELRAVGLDPSDVAESDRPFVAGPSFRPGDRVLVIHEEAPQCGCVGTVAETSPEGWASAVLNESGHTIGVRGLCLSDSLTWYHPRHIRRVGRAPVSLEGELAITENEGGFADAGLYVGDECLATAIAKACGGQVGRYRGGDVDEPEGGWPRVRVTVEVLE